MFSESRSMLNPPYPQVSDILCIEIYSVVKPVFHQEVVKELVSPIGLEA